jgi:hypothetical protein
MGIGCRDSSNMVPKTKSPGFSSCFLTPLFVSRRRRLGMRRAGSFAVVLFRFYFDHLVSVPVQGPPDCTIDMGLSGVLICLLSGSGVV